jgi:AraC family transcriptional regulator
LYERADLLAVMASGASMATTAKPIAGVGRVYFWSGGSLWLGRDAGRGHAHSHHAMQITLALEGSFLLRDCEGDAWSEFRRAIVLPHCRHQFDGCGTSITQIFVEPETAPGRALLHRFEGASITALPGRALDEMLGLLRARCHEEGAEALIAAGQSALAKLAGSGAPAAVADPRIAKGTVAA